MAYPATFTDIVAQVVAKARLDATADATAAGTWVNQAYFAACIENEVSETSGTVTLTANTYSYDLTSFLTAAIVRVKAMVVTSAGTTFAPLQYVPLDEILARRQSSAATGIAEFYTLVGYKTLELFPTPGAADTLTIYYIAAPTVLATTAVPILPEPYGSKVLEYGALCDAAEFKSDPQLAYWQEKHGEWSTRLRVHLNRRRSGQVGQLSGFGDREWIPHDPSTILPA